MTVRRVLRPRLPSRHCSLSRRATALAAPGDIERLTAESTPADANDDPDSASAAPAISGDGALVAFQSSAEDLVADDSNFFIDVFLRARLTDSTTRESLTSAEGQLSGGGSADAGDGGQWHGVGVQLQLDHARSGHPAARPDRCVPAHPSGGNHHRRQSRHGSGSCQRLERRPGRRRRRVGLRVQVRCHRPGGLRSQRRDRGHLHEHGSAAPTRWSASRPSGDGANGDSSEPVPRPLGRRGSRRLRLERERLLRSPRTSTRLATCSCATGRARLRAASVVHDRHGGKRRPASSPTSRAKDATSSSYRPLQSRPRRLTGGRGVYVRDRTSNTTERIDLTFDGSPAERDSHPLSSISDDGRYVAFASNGDRLVPGDTTGFQDVFVRDRTAGPHHPGERAGRGRGGGQQQLGGALGRPRGTAIAGDGSVVAFESEANNLVSGDDTDAHHLQLRRDLLHGARFQPAPDHHRRPAARQPTAPTGWHVGFGSTQDGLDDFQCRLDRGAFTACTSPWLTPQAAVWCTRRLRYARDRPVRQPRGHPRRGLVHRSTAAAGPARTAQPPPPPVFRTSFNLEPVSGTVFVTVPGGRRVRLQDLIQIPSGSLVDTRKGRVRLFAAATRRGSKIVSSEFFEGLFRVVQLRDGITELRLAGGSFRGCTARRSTVSTAARKSKRKKVRRLWGKGKGQLPHARQVRRGRRARHHLAGRGPLRRHADPRPRGLGHRERLREAQARHGPQGQALSRPPARPPLRRRP